MSLRSYEDAINHLNTLQTNASILQQIRASGGLVNSLAIPEMVEYLERIGYTTNDLNKLNVIHVTGTKGKGTTCAFVNSILRQSKPDWNIGLYTSPHMIAVRERVRINGTPLSETDFAKFFFEVWDRLGENDVRKLASTKLRPTYFRFLTLVAFHTFLTLKVDATVLEVGVGGAYDSTNIVPRPIATGVTSLGIDHVGVLGSTLKEIAWHKGGIYKAGVPAFSSVQPDEAIEVLRQRAKEAKASDFSIVPPNQAISNIGIALPGVHHIQNASLAVELAKVFLESQVGLQVDQSLPESFVQGLMRTRWPGRCQTVEDPVHSRTTWFLDGAHTKESIEYCIEWLVNLGMMSRKDSTRILIFNCTGGRPRQSLLATMYAKAATHSGSAAPFEHVIFCTNVNHADGKDKSDHISYNVDPEQLTRLTVQRELATAWAALDPSLPADHIHVVPSIEHAVNVVRALDGVGGERVDVLVTGSLHLVAGVIEVAGLAEVAL